MDNLKIIFISLLYFIISSQESNGQTGKIAKVKFVSKIYSTCTIAGSKLVLLPHKKPKGYVPYACTYEQDKIFSGYSDKDKREILAELLSYEGDTSICSKRVCRYGYTNDKRPGTESYTIQIDALYLLTTLVVGGYATNYCPYPVLVEISTGKEINDFSEQVGEIYAIYRKWYEENSKNGFKNFNVPLRNTRYAWYGMRDSKKYLLKDSFKIHKLGSAFAVVGVCLD